MRIAIIALLGVSLAACSSAPQSSFRNQVIDRALAGAPGQAQPGTIVATELAFARMAREEGQWTAFAEFATDDAIMFAPERVNARSWLKGRANPQQSVGWQPHYVWMSCDGSLAVTKGAWQQPDGSHGYFTTVWQRQKKGAYKWVMDQGDKLATPLVEPEFIQTQVADCGIPDTLAAQGGGPWLSADAGRSQDMTLQWSARVAANKAREIRVHIWKDGAFQSVIAADVAVPTD